MHAVTVLFRKNRGKKHLSGGDALLGGAVTQSSDNIGLFQWLNDPKIGSIWIKRVQAAASRTDFLGPGRLNIIITKMPLFVLHFIYQTNYSKENITGGQQEQTASNRVHSYNVVGLYRSPNMSTCCSGHCVVYIK